MSLIFSRASCGMLGHGRHGVARSPGLVRRAEVGVPHSGTDCEGRCWISSGTPNCHLPQDLREVPKDAAAEALRSLVRAAAGPEVKFWAGAETTVGELAAATTSGAGLAKKQSKVFDPGGGL